MTGGTEIENIKLLGQVSFIMRSLTRKNGDLLSQFDNINEEIGADENGTSNDIRRTSLHKMLINNHIEANRGKRRGELPLEDVFGFWKTFKKLTKNFMVSHYFQNKRFKKYYLYNNCICYSDRCNN